MGKPKYIICGLERSDALPIYDITNPAATTITFCKTVKTVEIPEGVFISIPCLKVQTKEVW